MWEIKSLHNTFQRRFNPGSYEPVVPNPGPGEPPALHILVFNLLQTHQIQIIWSLTQLSDSQTHKLNGILRNFKEKTSFSMFFFLNSSVFLGFVRNIIV